ncbi:MAG: hypothetical protein ACSW8I_06535 [bacterium]
MKKILLAAAAFSFLISHFSFLHAQEEGTYNESVLVRGSYRPVIDDAEKLTFPALVTDTLGRIGHTFTYTLSPSSIKAPYQPSRIKAARIIGEPTTRLYNNYLRLGFGNYWSPLADLYWTSTRDTLKTYGLRFNHRSSWGSIPDYGKNHYGLTSATLFGKLIVRHALQLYSDLSFEHDHNLYYGFTDDMLLSTLGLDRGNISLSDYRANYNLLAANLGLRSLQPDSDRVGYGLNLRLADLWGSWGQNEFNLSLSGNLHYAFILGNSYRGKAFLNALWDGYVHRNSPYIEHPLGYSPPLFTPSGSQETVKHSRNIVRLNPCVELAVEGLLFHVGVTTAWDAYTKKTTKIRIFPDVSVSKQLLGGAMVLVLGAIGGIDANNWNTLRTVNPYLTPEAEVRATHHYDFASALRWTISKKIEANFLLQYSMFRNDLTFTLDPDYSLETVFRPLYLDDNRLTLGADIAFVNDELLTLRAAAHYYRYTSIHYNDAAFSATLTSVHSPLYRPDWDLLFTADLNYHSRWLLHLETQLLGKMPGDLNKDLTPRLGIGAEIEYRHNRALSFFLRMENLAFQRYRYWTNYPSQRGLFLAGLTYTL